MSGQELLIEVVGAETIDAIADKKPVKAIRKYWNIITITIIVGVGIYSYVLLS